MILYTITIKITVDFYVKESKQKRRLNIKKYFFLKVLLNK